MTIRIKLSKERVIQSKNMDTLLEIPQNNIALVITQNNDKVIILR